MFICPNCKRIMTLPSCSCGYLVMRQNNIWQLSDMPDIVTDGDGDKYIGYEHIGESYSGSRKYVIEERDALFAREISEMTGDGVFLDLACGDGCLTVPCAANGTRVIAGDISNHMLSILQQKAKHNQVSLTNVTLCRMNALEIPLEEESVDTAVANSMLHLVSNPQKVIFQIHHVLKKGGVFLCVDDRPGRIGTDQFDNVKYNEIVNSFYRQYWNKLKIYGIYPVKYSWKFDRAAVCDHLFEHKDQKIIEGGKVYERPLKDSFLPRFCGRGFSDQVDVPKELHDSVIAELLTEFQLSYGDSFADTAFKGIEEDLVITIYTK